MYNIYIHVSIYFNQNLLDFTHFLWWSSLSSPEIHPSCHLQVTFDAIKRATAELQDVAWRISRISRISDMKRRDQKKGKI